LSATFGSTTLPGLNFSFEQVAVVDPAVKTLSAHDTDLDLGHIEPARVAGRVVEFQTFQNPTRLGGWEGLIDSGGRVG
jgi:hypothetical protein